MTIRRFLTLAMIAVGAGISANEFAPAQNPPQPDPTATMALPSAGPADPKLRAISLPDGKTMHLLPATLETTQWGWFDNAQPPVLRIRSGDTVVLETMMHSHNQVVPGTTIEQIKKLRTDFPGRGPHTVTGPIYVEEAQPGDVLKVRLNKIVPRAYATNFNVPGMFGEFPNIYQDGQVKYLYLDLDKKVTEFLPGIYLPLRPFPGTIGVARKEPGRYSTVPPGEYAGNMDIRDLVQARHSTCLCRCPAPSCGREIPMPARATAKSTSPQSRPPTASSTSRSRSSRESRLIFHASKHRARGSPWASIRI